MFSDIIIERKKVDRNIHPNFIEIDDKEVKCDDVRNEICKEFTEDNNEHHQLEDENEFSRARHTMFEYFNTDDGLEISYRSNIAMFLNDRCDITDHDERNKLAKELMNLLWGY